MKPIRRVDVFEPPKRIMHVRFAPTMGCGAVLRVLAGGEAYAWVLTEVRK